MGFWVITSIGANATPWFVILETLKELVDFDLLNSGAMRLSIGAVQVLTGNMKYFDTAKQQVGLEHVMASGALPPGFPPIEIGASAYDG